MFVVDIIPLFRLQNLTAIAYRFFHTTIRSLKCNLESFQNHSLNELRFHFIGVSETRICNESIDLNPAIANYNFKYVPTPLRAGSVGLYFDSSRT